MDSELKILGEWGGQVAASRRAPCWRCKLEPCGSSWTVAAVPERFFGLCRSCDCELEAIILSYIGLPDEIVELAVSRYERIFYKDAKS